MAETKLCSACSSIFSDHSLDRYYLFDELQWEDGCRQASILVWHAHHVTADNHRKAILEGCLLCSWIPDPGLDSYRTFFRFDRYYRRTADNVQEEVCEIFLGLPSLHRSYDDRTNRSYRMAVEKCGPEETVLERLAASSRVSPSTGHADTLQLAKGWLEHCLENHRECIPTLHPSWVPTRLLALQNSHATLIDTNVISPSGPYATLSHCWGGMPSFVLESDNMGMFKQGLPFSKFDPTFRDAMIAGQTLGINYLWIDCYCIIQGTDETSRDDWNRESVLMHKVYTNALLNIGAAHGKESQAGCFKIHQRKEDVFGKILWKPSSRSTRSLHRLINSSLRLKERNEMDLEVRSFAILDRGWIVQERMLAQRMLYFGNIGIYWDCASTDIKSEQWPGGKGLGQNPLSLAPGRLNGRRELRRGKRYGTWLSAID